MTNRLARAVADHLSQRASTIRYQPLPTYQTFPVDLLPSALGQFVSQGALSLGCDPAFVALPALSAAASLIGNTRTIRLKGSWKEPCVVWTAVVADSGTLKSPAHLMALRPIFDRQRTLCARFKESIERYEQEMARIKKEPGKPPPPKLPRLGRVVCGDTTIEKLAEILEDNPRGLLVARDELHGWFGSFARYRSKGAGTDLPHWLEFHRAGNLLQDRKGGERREIFVDRAAVSVTGGIQPGVLAKILVPEFLESGLAARMLMAMPTKLPKRWIEAEIDHEIAEAYHVALDRLGDLEFDACTEGTEPVALPLSPEAKQAWVKFYDDWGTEQASVDAELAASFSKLEA